MCNGNCTCGHENEIGAFEFSKGDSFLLGARRLEETEEKNKQKYHLGGGGSAEATRHFTAPYVSLTRSAASPASPVIANTRANMDLDQRDMCASCTGTGQEGLGTLDVKICHEEAGRGE